MNDAQFHFVGSRKSQQEARVAERERLKAMASGSSDTENPDDGGEDLGEQPQRHESVTFPVGRRTP